MKAVFRRCSGAVLMGGLLLVAFVSAHASEAAVSKAETFSPLHHIAPGAPPTLIIQGADDDLTPLDRAELFTKKMREAGNSVERVRKEGPDYPHGFITPGYGKNEVILNALERSLNFMIK